MFNLATLRALKGAPLSILIAMMIAQQPVGEGWLETITGYSQNTVRNGCKFLLEIQMIQRNSRYQGYTLTNGARQLAIENDPFGERQKMTLPDPTTTDTLNKKEADESEERAVEEDQRAVKNDSRLVLLYSAGIMEPTASRLLEKSWMTYDYIEAHIDKADREGTAIPLLIHRIRSHDPKPREKDCQSPESYQRSWFGNEAYERRN
jgi:hypothetical protein